jgi:hypothetical protein
MTASVLSNHLQAVRTLAPFTTTFATLENNLSFAHCHFNIGCFLLTNFTHVSCAHCRDSSSDARTRFFLATDDPAVEKLVCERYGGLVQVHAKRNYNRRNRVSAQH